MTLLEALRERVLLFDGAMGTQIHAADLGLDDFWDQEGNVDILNLSRPDVVRDIHARYLEAGADCVETNAFGANRIVQAEYGMQDRAREIAVAAARLAREAASGFSARWVVGNLGPGTKSPSLGHVRFDEIEDAYGEQASGLIEGGADALIVETCFDLLQCKAAIAGCRRAFAEHGRKLPLIVQVTIETTGSMLLGSDIACALATLDGYPEIDVVGLNCATGPAEMIEHVRYLCRHSRRPVSVQPNAGLPELRDGVTFFPLTPEEFVSHHATFVEEFGVSVVGGCCGTTPEYIRRLADALHGRTPATRDPQPEPACASLYIAQPFAQETSFFVIGERCNTNGSKRFKELISSEDFDATLEVASEQLREGAHALDVCVDYVGRDGVPDMHEVVSRFRTKVTLPLFIDSTEPPVIETALKLIGGRAVINSINLEEGDAPGSRLRRNLDLARRFGAACIALAIEEQGQATDADWKLRVCRRLYDIALDAGLRPEDLIYDVLVFPISTGMEDARRAGVETLDAVARVKQELPGCYTSLGISNVSFGLNAAARVVLNSMFLHEAVERGLDAAIVSPAKILPPARIGEDQRQAALDVIYDRRREGYDPLQTFISLFEGVSGPAAAEREDLSALPLEERLQRRIVDGQRKGLDADLDEALGRWPALEIVNSYLLEGMRVVGDLFGSGEMQLPFVLQSAETMKAAVAHLEPHMERVGDGSKGRLVLATVKGDVHDIGKNLVDIILSNNGYTVFNIGIKQPINEIVAVAERESCDAIGMSGLLVRSTVVMRENLEELNRRGLHTIPVLLGGAALTRRYVEDDLRSLYKGPVFYGKDAFEGLRTMDAIMTAKREGRDVEVKVRERPVAKVKRTRPESLPERSDVARDVPVPVPPFFGSRVVKATTAPDVARYLNRTALFRNQWQYRRRKGQSLEEYQAFLETQAEAVFRDWLARCIEEQILQPAVVYGYFHVRSDGDDLIVYRDDATTEWVRFTFPRQPTERRLCISDFFRSDVTDVAAFHIVTMGARVSEVTRELFEADRYTDYLHLHGLGVEMAEGLAELWHARIRSELGIADRDAPTVEELFDQGYRGSRYSFGYPACPNLEDQTQLFELLSPHRIGVSLSEEFQLVPEQSTSAIVVHHPEARYFTIAAGGMGE